MGDARRDRVERAEPDDDEDAERDGRDVHEGEIGKDRATERDVADHDEKAEHREQVEESLRDHDAHGPRERHAETPLHEVAAVEVAELGGHETVDEPAEEEDLEEIATADPRAAFAEQSRPADRPHRERHVVDDERREHPEGIRAADRRERLAEVDVPSDDKDEEDGVEDRYELKTVNESDE